MLAPYAELHCVSNFSFLRGASHPEELVDRAQALGYAALAITDECSLAGVVRAHLQARASSLPLVVGAEFSLRDIWPRRPDGIALPAAACRPEHDARLVLLATDREGYGNLSELITRARMRAAKGSYRLEAADLADGIPGCLALLVPEAAALVEPAAHRRLLTQAGFVRERFGQRGRLAAELLTRGHDTALLGMLRDVAREIGLPLVAAGDVHYHRRARKSLHDTLAAIRLRKPLAECGLALAPNAEQHLRSRLRLAQRYPPDLLEETVRLAASCRFSLDELRYEYPEEIVPADETPAGWLRKLTLEGLQRRYPAGPPEAVREQIERELALVAELRYEPYFLTVADLVAFARERGILCQGRGSAANSAICYCLGITAVDPAHSSLLFERFISRERNEPPDIDVDFEHQRREEVIQYLYAKYGRERAALTATVISYRPRSALRDVGRALGIDAQRLDLMARSQQWWDGREVIPERLAEVGFDPASPVVQHWMRMVNILIRFPRHLSQHTGGFVIARDRLSRLVPIENAAMADRSVIQWDKDDLDALGLLKVDVLALGMLSAIRRALEFINLRRTGNHAGRLPCGREAPFRMQDIPDDDTETYDMICKADTIGVFQIESRAQMSMLPRLRPRKFYDLVVQVAIVRPGPIQGDMVHPYLRRRQGLEPVDYPLDEIRPALERTFGVPIFQEQVMQVAIIAADFTPGEADQLRRAMAAWKRKGGLGPFQERVIAGMRKKGYPPYFADRIFRQIEGFGEYGFPESHAAGFAQLVYVSSWIKCHEPAAFLAAMLDSQPMGFYAPAQLVRDAREHGVEVRGVDVLASEAGCTLEEQDSVGAVGSDVQIRDGIDRRPQPAVRLGLAQVRGLSAEGIERLLEARRQREAERGIGHRAEAPDRKAVPARDDEAPGRLAFDSVEDLAREARLDTRDLEALARADALRRLAGHRAQAHWEAAGLAGLPALLEPARFDEAPVLLPTPAIGDETIADYRALGIPMGAHPVALLRRHLDRFGVRPASELAGYANGQPARASGLVTHRQRPGTAKGVVFVTLEDDTGQINVIVWRHLIERYRAAVVGARLMTVYGIWQCDPGSGQVRHLVARRILDHSALLGRLATRSRDFR
ncbi:MAG: error-prone DNA polymerase [Burkholderiaceae bacterium]|nr:error-prone DNA polymerase [Burkholderiaceae bacterium]